MNAIDLDQFCGIAHFCSLFDNFRPKFIFGLIFVPIPVFSPAAFRKGLVNAFSYRDYSILQGIRVAVDDEGLTISSPGGFIPYISRPVSVDGIPCPDSGCCEKVPYRWALDQGFEKIARLAAGGRIFLFILIFIMVFRHFLESLVYACSP